ncbi:ATP-dependent carboxylate-amine ligase [Tropicimonas sp. IMCC6043]|uniref:ATP-binding protein n=1 Tax=Tropicimonas sp. IMCC6043 TaxID=2510645 RepID=UPI00101E039A|nr:ATP-dependent carboxylate-amine ligase [Tropicimonas sp. IMCC6043]RYH08290.1 ATP-dependent carboxylate-amine ligase [Tropicimonas sp. IMCC6043]
MALRLAPPDSAFLARATPFVRLLHEAADALGARLDMECDYAFIGRLTAPDGRRMQVFGKSIGLNTDAAAHLAADKDYAARWLAAEGLPTPPGQLDFSPAWRARMALKNATTAERLPGPDAAAEFARRQGYPVIVKPNTGSEGRDIRLCEDPKALSYAISEGFGTDDVLRVEPRLPGRDYRLLVLDGTVRLAYERNPFSVTGDGESSIATLIADALTRFRSQHRGAKVSADDPRLLRRLAADGLSPATILPAGRRQPLLDNANLSTGGELVDLTGHLPPAAESLATRAATSLGLALAGIDILAPDLAAGPEGATILEVNSAPGLDYFATSSPEAWLRARSLVTEMLRLRLGIALA